MKKVLLLLAAVSLVSFTACKDDKKTAENPEGVDSMSVSIDSSSAKGVEPASTPEASSTDTPKFSDADVQKFADDYTAYVKDITAAYKSKDATKIAELGQKGQEWATKSAEISKKLASNPEDAKKFAEYTQKVAQEMQAAMTAQ